jgi:hypothetical protein
LEFVFLDTKSKAVPFIPDLAQRAGFSMKKIAGNF